MTQKQDSRLKMYYVLNDYLSLNKELVSSLPNISDYISSFQNAITTIQNLAQQQRYNHSGFQIDKKLLKNKLVLATIDTSRKLQAYAKFINNQNLLQDNKLTESTLKNAADIVLSDYAKSTYNRAQNYLVDLAPYGVSDATQVDLLNIINEFIIAIPKPRTNKIDTKVYTIQIANSFEIADEAIDNIDILVEILRISQSNFYFGYKSTRKIINTGNTSLALRGLILNNSNNEPLRGVTLSFELINNNDLSKSALNKTISCIVKKTAAKGRFNIKTLGTGEYTVTAMKVGFIAEVQTLAISQGELKQLVINLTPNN